jgi:hypothetical protein
MNSMPIDLAAVNWVYVGVLAVFVFLASLIGNLLSLNHRGTAALLSAILFAAAFVAWSYYPHEYLPLPTAFSGQRTPVTTAVASPAPAAAAPAAPAAPVKPANPVTTISPPPAATTTPPPQPPKQ